MVADREGAAEETELLHDSPRRDDDRRTQDAGALLRHDDGAAVDRKRKRGEVRVPVRRAAADSQREGCRRVGGHGDAVIP